ncbi:hypothetical protein B0H10DRAFT_1959959 [Mycena sp. CBHHK59/15]|nr:hypothetical protein B0H10DRAFT_1959959 [Mycena sp. CBHHK59/15]
MLPQALACLLHQLGALALTLHPAINQPRWPARICTPSPTRAHCPSSTPSYPHCRPHCPREVVPNRQGARQLGAHIDLELVDHYVVHVLTWAVVQCMGVMDSYDGCAGMGRTGMASMRWQVSQQAQPVQPAEKGQERKKITGSKRRQVAFMGKDKEERHGMYDLVRTHSRPSAAQIDTRRLGARKSQTHLTFARKHMRYDDHGHLPAHHRKTLVHSRPVSNLPGVTKQPASSAPYTLLQSHPTSSPSRTWR